MAGKAVSYRFVDVLAKSVGMNADTVKQALEPAVQDKAPMNHASQQPVFGAANEQMPGNVKIVHDNA